MNDSLIMISEQAVSQLLLSDPIKISLIYVSSIFDLFMFADTTHDKNNLLCFIHGLTAEQKMMIVFMGMILFDLCSCGRIITHSSCLEINFKKILVA